MVKIMEQIIHVISIRNVNQKQISLDVFSVMMAKEDVEILVRFIQLVLLLQIKDVKKVFLVPIAKANLHQKVIVWQIKDLSAIRKVIAIQDYLVRPKVSGILLFQGKGVYVSLLEI